MLDKKYPVSKSNLLTEMRTNSMTIQELRFLSIYISKINPTDINSRYVEFTLNEFQKIMNLGRVNKKYIKEVFSKLLCKQVEIPIDTSRHQGFEIINLFNKCQCFWDNEIEDTLIIIDVHDDMLPLLFDLKQNYLKYQLWNCLRLKSANQVRLYELLKQYEKLGTRIIAIDELRIMLGIKKTEYPVYSIFRRDVIDVCQKALKENTDIYFEYEPIRKGRKFLFIKFIIYKNKDYKDPLGLDEFIVGQDEEEFIEEPLIELTLAQELLFDAVNHEFNSIEEINIIFDKISCLDLPEHLYGIDIARFHFVQSKYLDFKLKESELRCTENEIKKPFNYFITMLK